MGRFLGTLANQSTQWRRHCSAEQPIRGLSRWTSPTPSHKMITEKPVCGITNEDKRGSQRHFVGIGPRLEKTWNPFGAGTSLANGRSPSPSPTTKLYPGFTQNSLTYEYPMIGPSLYKAEPSTSFQLRVIVFCCCQIFWNNSSPFKYWCSRNRCMDHCLYRFNLYFSEAPSDEFIRCDRHSIFFKTHPLLSKYPHTLRIQFYFDDVETVNALGSKTKKHEIGMFCFRILNLPMTENSKLANILRW